MNFGFQPRPASAFSTCRLFSSCFDFKLSTLNRFPATPFPACPPRWATLLPGAIAKGAAASSVTPLFATLTENTRGVGSLHLGFRPLPHFSTAADSCAHTCARNPNPLMHLLHGLLYTPGVGGCHLSARQFFVYSGVSTDHGTRLPSRRASLRGEVCFQLSPLTTPHLPLPC
jgi:hypothetical protein